MILIFTEVNVVTFTTQILAKKTFEGFFTRPIFHPSMWTGIQDTSLYINTVLYQLCYFAPGRNWSPDLPSFSLLFKILAYSRSPAVFME